MLRELWTLLASFATVSVVGVAVVLVADRALFPSDHTPPISRTDQAMAAENAALQSDLRTAQGEVARLQAENATLKVNFEFAMKFMVLAPRKPASEDRPAPNPDLIPVQNVPTMESPRP